MLYIIKVNVNANAVLIRNHRDCRPLYAVGIVGGAVSSRSAS